MSCNEFIYKLLTEAGTCFKIDCQIQREPGRKRKNRGNSLTSANEESVRRNQNDAGDISQIAARRRCSKYANQNASYNQQAVMYMISESAPCCIVHKCAKQKQANVCWYHDGGFHLDHLRIYRCYPSLVETRTMKKLCKRVPKCSFCSGTSKLTITKNVSQPLTKQV